MLNLIELPYLGALRNLHFSINQRYPTKKTQDTVNMTKFLKKRDTQLSTSPEDIRQVLNEFFDRCKFPYHELPYDIDLHNLCLDEARKHGYPIENTAGAPSILKSLPAGVVIAATSYAHLNNREVQVFIALYTAFLVHLDDCVNRDVEGVDLFNERFISGQSQANGVLDSLALFLGRIHRHYTGVQANIIMTSTLNFVTSVVLEHKTQAMQPSPDAYGYPTFSRYLSGVSEAYAFFIFPSNLPFGDYIQSLPEMTMFINCANDVLSFYKEESAGETVNYISIQAGFRGKSKLEILGALADDVATCYERVMRIVETKEEAKSAFRAFAMGYLEFHTSLNKRYHLEDLFVP